MVIRKNSTKPGRRKEQICSITALKRMVTIPRKLFLDDLKSHLIWEPGKKMEKNGINEYDGANRR
jgi:hypothetical protein